MIFFILYSIILKGKVEEAGSLVKYALIYDRLYSFGFQRF